MLIIKHKDIKGEKTFIKIARVIITEENHAVITIEKV